MGDGRPIEKKACCGPLPGHVYFHTDPQFVKRKLDDAGKQVGVSLCEEAEAYALRCPECGRCYPKESLKRLDDAEAVKTLGHELIRLPDGGAAELGEVDDLQQNSPRKN